MVRQAPVVCVIHLGAWLWLLLFFLTLNFICTCITTINSERDALCITLTVHNLFCIMLTITMMVHT